MITDEKAAPADVSIVRSIMKRLPWLFYTGVHTFRVQSAEQEQGGAQSGGKLALEPSGTRRFKAEPIVLQWSTAGTVIVPKVGSEVGIVFLDHDPTRPAIVAWQALSLAGGRPDVVELDADTRIRLGRHAASVVVGPGTPPAVGRVGDAVAIGTLTVSGVPGALLQFTPAGGAPGPISAGVSVSGVISAGSPMFRSA